MARASILVAHNSAEKRDSISAALYDAGFDSVPAKNGMEAVRSTVGLNPSLVVAQAGLSQISGYELPERLQATGLALPPVVILFDAEDELPEKTPEGEIYCVFSQGLQAEHLVQKIKLLLLAREVEGEFGENLDRMYGDLTRTPFADILSAAQRYVLSGRLDFNRGAATGLWISEGQIVDAWWGPVRGRKAFNRMAGMPSGGFSLRLAPFEGESTLEGVAEDLLMDALDERFGFDDAMAALPPPESKPELQMVADIFNMEFTAVERQVMTKAQDAATISDLIDSVESTDLEAAQAIANLANRGLLEFKKDAAKTFVFTDSTADLLPSDASRLGITVIPVSIVFGTDVYRDGIDLKPEAYAKMLKEKEETPITHPVSKGQFIESYRRFIAEGDILGIYCSAKLSKTHVNAEAAINEAMDEFRSIRQESGGTTEPEIVAIDSGQCSGPLGLLAMFAVRMLRSGASLKEVATHISAMRKRMRTVLVVKNLDYLAQSGEIDVRRANKMRNKRTDSFIFELSGGELMLRDCRPPGPRSRSRMLELLSAGLDLSQPVYAVVVHAAAPVEAAAMRPLIHEKFNIVEISEEQIGPAVTSHNGPGTFGVTIFQPTAEELEMLQQA